MQGQLPTAKHQPPTQKTKQQDRTSKYFHIVRNIRTWRNNRSDLSATPQQGQLNMQLHRHRAPTGATGRLSSSAAHPTGTQVVSTPPLMRQQRDRQVFQSICSMDTQEVLCTHHTLTSTCMHLPQGAASTSLAARPPNRGLSCMQLLGCAAQLLPRRRRPPAATALQQPTACAAAAAAAAARAPAVSRQRRERQQQQQTATGRAACRVRRSATARGRGCKQQEQQQQ